MNFREEFGRPRPQVSMVMPVYNAAPFLDESIRSILEQTFKDFEFVLLDDASIDNSLQIARGWAERDARIRVVAETNHLGPVGSSNLGVGFARAELIARMDADDVSHPE